MVRSWSRIQSAWLVCTTSSGDSCARTTAGAVVCWGGGAPTPVWLDLPPASQLALGVSHACAIVSGGLLCWGENENGELGDGTTLRREAPVVVRGLDGIVEITSKRSHTCARREDGATWCWGDGSYGQLGPDGKPKTPAPVAVPGRYRSLRAEYLFACGLDIGGRIHCEDYDSTPRPLAELILPVDDFATGGRHGCAWLAGEGTRVACWGANGYGQGGAHTLP